MMRRGESVCLCGFLLWELLRINRKHVEKPNQIAGYDSIRRGIPPDILEKRVLRIRGVLNIGIT